MFLDLFQRCRTAPTGRVFCQLRGPAFAALLVAQTLLSGAWAQGILTDWNLPAPAMPAATVPLTTAVALLTPSGQRLPSLVQAAHFNAPVAWEQGETRMQALQGVLKSQGLYAVGDAQVLRIYSSDAAAAVPQKAAPPVSDWSVHEGQPISSAIQTWGHRAGWTVLWQLDQDWKAPHDTVFKGDFETAASNAVRALAANGADIRAVFYPDNKTLAIRPAGN